MNELPFGKPGEQILNLFRTAERELLIVAPFIKVGALSRLLDVVHDRVKVTCITRWHPAELALGVSDMAVWNIIRDLDGASLWLRNDLHAKYYRADSSVLAGSANITMAALGWSQQSNLELLIPLNSDTNNLSQFEQILYTRCVQVDDEMYAVIRGLVQDLQTAMPLPPVANNEPDHDDEQVSKREDLPFWFPSFRRPEELYLVYRGEDTSLTTAAVKIGRGDLEALNVPYGLTEPLFNQYIAACLIQHPLVNAVDKFLVQARRFGEVKRYLRRQAPDLITNGDEASRAWQTLMRWLMYFLPQRYLCSVPNYTEVFQRVDV